VGGFEEAISNARIGVREMEWATLREYRVRK
jgi:hypothetical protein